MNSIIYIYIYKFIIYIYVKGFNQGTENCKLIELVDGACVGPLKKAKIDGVHTWGSLEKELVQVFVLGFVLNIVQNNFLHIFCSFD